MHAGRSGLLSRPSLDQVYGYRDRVDDAIQSLLDRDANPELVALVELACITSSSIRSCC
jgi:hypothetical protein